MFTACCKCKEDSLLGKKKKIILNVQIVKLDLTNMKL